MLFDLELQPSELGEKAFANALISRRDDLLKRLSEAPPNLEAMLLLRAEALVLRDMFKQTRQLIETERENRKQRHQSTGNSLATAGLSGLMNRR